MPTSKDCSSPHTRLLRSVAQDELDVAFYRCEERQAVGVGGGEAVGAAVEVEVGEEVTKFVMRCLHWKMGETLSETDFETVKKSGFQRSWRKKKRDVQFCLYPTSSSSWAWKELFSASEIAAMTLRSTCQRESWNCQIALRTLSVVVVVIEKDKMHGEAADLSAILLMTGPGGNAAV